MARPPFVPDDEQRKTLAALTRIAKARAKLDTEADQLIAVAAQQGIPVSHVATALGRQRKTVYRHQGKKMK